MTDHGGPESSGGDRLSRETTDSCRPSTTSVPAVDAVGGSATTDEIVASPKLVVRERGVVRHILLGATMIVGRLRGVGLRVEDPKVSRRHCCIERRGGRYVVVDLGSTNGTVFNGRRIAGGKKTLRHGDIIQVGNTELRFVAKRQRLTGSAPTGKSRKISAEHKRGLRALCELVEAGARAANAELARAAVLERARRIVRARWGLLWGVGYGNDSWPSGLCLILGRPPLDKISTDWWAARLARVATTGTVVLARAADSVVQPNRGEPAGRDSAVLVPVVRGGSVMAVLWLGGLTASFSTDHYAILKTVGWYLGTLTAELAPATPTIH